MKLKTGVLAVVVLLLSACAYTPPSDPNYPYGLYIPVKPEQTYHN